MSVLIDPKAFGSLTYINGGKVVGNLGLGYSGASVMEKDKTWFQ
jgi:hypothetical protein